MGQLRLSKYAINEAIMQFEVGYDTETGFAYYNKFLAKPTVPDPENTSSGVTIGIGFDCGYYSKSEIENVWKDYLPKEQVDALVNCAGLKKWAANTAAKRLSHIKVSSDIALKVFYRFTLPKFARLTWQIYPNIINIHEVEQSVFVGLVYNRGNSLKGERRKEMRDLVKAIANDNDKEMARIIRAMKHLWINTAGLVRRRNVEAYLVELADTSISEQDLLIVDF